MRENPNAYIEHIFLLGWYGIIVVMFIMGITDLMLYLYFKAKNKWM